MPNEKSKPANFESIASEIAADFAKLSAVSAIALGGSVATGKATKHSDIDLYIYVSEAVPVETRVSIIRQRSYHYELDAPYWETEDYWIEATSLIKVEVIYRDEWIFEELEKQFKYNHAHMGFSTSLWHNVVSSKTLFDRDGWLRSLKALADRPYPDALAVAIISKNYPLLRGSLVAHPNQLAVAIERNDKAFIINLLHMILNSYFDILFALNKELHCGAKRQLDYARNLPLRPEHMVEDVEALLSVDLTTITETLERLIQRLEKLLKARSLIH